MASTTNVNGSQESTSEQRRMEKAGVTTASQQQLTLKKTKLRSPRNSALKLHLDNESANSQHCFASAADSPILSRTRNKVEKEKMRAGSTSSTNSKLRMQRERRRTKRREAYMPSTEGTSTGEEDNELFSHQECHKLVTDHHHEEDSTNKAPPQARSHFPRKLSASIRASKSPSDLEADDEDNQEYDSASVVSNLETTLSPKSCMVSEGHSHNIDNASFRAQFQEIRVAGMQQLAAAAAENDSSGLLSESSSANDDYPKLLEKERREKASLVQELAMKEQKIFEMDKIIKDLTRIREADLECERFKNENQSLQKALAKFK